MKGPANKFFVFGVIVLLLIAIPLTLYFVKKQQDLRSNAAPSSNLSFSPSTNSVKVGDQFDMAITVDPGENIVSYVKFNVLFDPQKLEAVKVVPSSSFPLTLEGPTVTSGSATVSLGIGADVTKAIQAPTQVAVITFKALTTTDSTPTEITFDTGNTQVLSLSASDQPGENVLSNTTPADITILTGDQTTSPTPTTTATPTPTPTPTTQPTPTQGVSSVNVAPTCTGLTVSPTASGAAPLSVTLAGSGSDSDGLITKASFDFGDGQAQDVTDGLNLSSVTPQISHTYQNAGTFNATVTFTDNGGSVSNSCTEVVTVSAAQTAGPTAPPATDTPRPTLAATGSSATILGIAGGIMVVIVGALVIFAL